MLGKYTCQVNVMGKAKCRTTNCWSSGIIPFLVEFKHPKV